MLVFNHHETLSSLQLQNSNLTSQVYSLSSENNALRQTNQALSAKCANFEGIISALETEKLNLISRCNLLEATMRKQQMDLSILSDRSQLYTQQIQGLLIDKSAANQALSTLTTYQRSLHEELQASDTERIKLQHNQDELLREVTPSDLIHCLPPVLETMRAQHNVAAKQFTPGGKLGPRERQYANHHPRFPSHRKEGAFAHKPPSPLAQ